jgi:hypothetical protein
MHMRSLCKGKKIGYCTVGFLASGGGPNHLAKVRLCRMSRRWTFDLIGVDKRSTQDRAAESYHTMHFRRMRCGEVMRLRQVIPCVE